MSHSSSNPDYLDNGPSKGGLADVAAFAGVLLIMLSFFQILEGIAAIANDKIFVRTPNYSFEFDVTTWGWVHLILGLIGVATGVGILMGQTWGRALGVLVAGVSAVSNFMFMPHYPFWSVTIIALDVLIMWALCHQIVNRDRT